MRMRNWVKRVVELLSKARRGTNGHSSTNETIDNVVVPVPVANGAVASATLIMTPTADVLPLHDTGDLDYEGPAARVQAAGDELKARTQEATSSAKRLVQYIRRAK